MENESNYRVENTDNSNEKLLLSDVINQVCEHDWQMFDCNSIRPDYCIKCGETK